jgi:adenosylhomocysteine nucleosidase
MARKAIAIVIAMRSELAPLLRGVRPQRINGVELFELENVAVGVGGIGRAPARRAAEELVRWAQPEILIAAGIAGAVSPRLKVGDVGWVREVVDVRTGDRYGTRYGDWLVATADSVSGPGDKRILMEQYGADVVDMEGAAVGSVARAHGIEFAAVKAVSDEAEFIMPPFSQFIEENGKLAIGRFAAHMAIRPQWWSTLVRLRANSRLAAVNLCTVVEHLITQEHVGFAREEKVPLA